MYVTPFPTYNNSIPVLSAHRIVRIDTKRTSAATLQAGLRAHGDGYIQVLKMDGPPWQDDVVVFHRLGMLSVDGDDTEDEQSDIGRTMLRQFPDLQCLYASELRLGGRARRANGSDFFTCMCSTCSTARYPPSTSVGCCISCRTCAYCACAPATLRTDTWRLCLSPTTWNGWN